MRLPTVYFYTKNLDFIDGYYIDSYKKSLLPLLFKLVGRVAYAFTLITYSYIRKGSTANR